ncbi:urea ABC transporter permease subunit UrtC [Kineosporia sp. R_H_3]|uniref:urea ABC transporter permease subunit UrtC n=1 Tax=Kineosporia sp. R_H_3 TaxID=1961848 RepID=UPI000B4BC649|nr:urea ABC transporter permease subunit UrtC [Kineosporia sp. R_H_3]
MSALDRLTRPGPLRAALGFGLGALVLLVVAPATLSQFRLDLLAKYLCFGIVAVGIGLAWGRGGMLTLGQGVYFGIGAYAMAMHLKLAQTPPGELPDFMQLYGEVTELPLWWQPFRQASVAVPATVLLPMLVAFVLGQAVFRRRIKGPYFAILSQALAAAMAILIVGQQGTTGGTNGLTDITSFFGYDLGDPVNRTTVYVVVAVCLLGCLAVARQLMQSRYGELLVAVRDAPERVRFLGYDPANVQTFAYTVAAGMAGLAGAMFVCAVQAINPASIDIVPSIAFVIGVAVGGRATLLGPALGAIGVAWLTTAASEALADRWTYIQGGLFILVVAFLPNGLASLPRVVGDAVRRRPAEVTS